ncbi:MAG TPA: GIY-YIG nuclease family protein [Cyclobacteriaceae bacterium]|nr:GIY-YIG nuclease family protein [Cyclobacteriaceae bacterium]
MECFVYILQSQKNGSFYKGSTDNLLRRLDQHNNGKDFATRRFLPWNLVWYTLKKDLSEAVTLEMKLKNLSVKRTVEFTLKYPVTENISGLIICPIENLEKK